jgi:peroxiredoxin
MKPILLLISSFLALPLISAAQKHFQITVKLDNGIDPQRVQCHYNNGKDLVFYRDVFKNSRQTVLKGTYYSKYASFSIYYLNKDTVYYISDFFLGEKPANITFHYKPNPEQLLLYSHINNARPVYDTVTNKTYRDLSRYNKAEGLANYAFYQKNKDQLGSSDSLMKVYKQNTRSLDRRSMRFLKNHSDDYFSFWLFKNDIATRSMKDMAYCAELMTYFKSTFPAKYTTSIEGREFIKTLEGVVHPLQQDQKAPAFTIKTIDSKNISLAKLKGKYVLLDFWATWCGPCMAEMPFIKSLMKNYAADKLVIIGISQDHDLKKLKLVVKQQNMNWLQFFDKETDISRLYGVTSFPTLILLDDQGKIIYKSDYQKDDKIEIPKLLSGLI